MDERPQIEQLLDRLGDLTVRRDAVEADRITAIDEAIPAEVRVTVAVLEKEYDEQVTAIEGQIQELRGRISLLVKDFGQSCSGQSMMAVYSDRKTWDTAGLEGYAVAHPEVLSFQKVAPSVSFRQKASKRS